MGNVHGGQQPVVGAHVYLFAANTTGYGNASVSLLNPAITGLSDSVGAYVLTTSSGSFSITGDYSCTPGTQVYLYALGGNPGAGVNSAAGFLAALGNCPASDNFLAATPFIFVNEVSTVAAAYSFAGFATDATHVSSSGTPLARIGIANAFANATNLADLSTGVALTTTPAGNGTVPQSVINTLANILAACVNSTGPSSMKCSGLFNNAESGGAIGTIPSDTANAAINIAHNPGTNTYGLYQLVAPSAPFAPALTNEPLDFAIGLTFSGGGVYGTTAIAVDGGGNVWVANELNSSISKFSSSGTAISPPTGFMGGGLSVPTAIAIDSLGSAWAENSYYPSVSKFSSAGAAMSPSTGFATGGSVALNSNAASIAIDGTDSIWIVTYPNPTGIVKLANSGVALSPAAGFADNGILGFSFGSVAIGPTGDAWVSLPNALAELSNAGSTVSPSSGFTATGLSNGPVAIDSSSNVWDCGSTLVKFSPSGTQIPLSSSVPGCGGPNTMAIDGSGNVWIAAYYGEIKAYSNVGTLLFPYEGFITGNIVGSQGFRPIALDGSGNVWLGNSANVAELIGAATPVVTPLSVGVKNNALGTRP